MATYNTMIIDELLNDCNSFEEQKYRSQVALEIIQIDAKI